jgi:hypothetical protein
MKKNKFEMIHAHEVKVGSEMWVYGSWLKVTRIKHLKWHPFQLYEFHFDEFREPLVRVPSGWELKMKATKDEDNNHE